MATPTTLPSTFVAGNVLTAAEMNNLRGAFRILQVVSTTKTDTFTASIASGGEASITGLSATITPTSTSSEILVMFSAVGTRASATPDSAILNLRLKRGATEIGSGTAAGNRSTLIAGGLTGGSGNVVTSSVSGQFLDSPSTTSATTYQLFAVNTDGSSTYTTAVNRTTLDSDVVDCPRFSSTITVMEVSA
jgi:hypothetical protein